ncbi:MAG: hypothetical protein HY927_05040 [Elusimicrobia bacterium]|nr:hypothetical protein [Elusimicrobiota bacterium]
MTCPKCGRGLTLNLEVLARRQACPYCGGALAIPAELEARLAALRAPKKAAAPVAVVCPVCGRTGKSPAAQVGKASQCAYCGARFVVPDAPGLGLDVRVVEGTPPIPLQGAVSKPATRQDPLTRLAWEALAARWLAGTVTKEEAAAILCGLDVLAEWRPAGAEVSPLPPHLTVQVAQYLVLRIMNAQSILEPAGSAILQIPLAGGTTIGSDSASDLGSRMGELLVLNAVGLGLLAITGTGFVAYGKPGESDKEEERVQVTPAVWLRFLPGPAGTTLQGEYQDQYGDRSPLDEEKIAKIAAGIRGGFRVPARAYLAFRALYGDWASPAIYTAASRDKVLDRVAGLPELAAEASDLTAALLAPGKQARPLSAPEV